MPELPSGCEIVSLVIALRSMGFPADKIEFADEYLEVDGELNGYLGSPYDYSGGCFPLGVVKLANSYLTKHGSFARGHDLSGSSFDSLKALTEAGYPVLLWTTYFIGQSWYEDGFEYNYDYYSYDGYDFVEGYDLEEGEPAWYEEEHCVVMFGVRGDKVLIADPLEGIYEREADAVASQYRQCGTMAMTVY